MGEEEKPAEVVTPEPEPEPEPEPAPIVAAPIPDEALPVLPEKVDPVDDLFHFVPGGEEGMYVIIRDPTTLLGYVDQGFKTFEKPFAALAAAAADGPDELKDAAEAHKEFSEGKTKYEQAADKIKNSGIDFSHGFVLASPDGEDKNMVAIYVAEKPDAFKELLSALDDDEASDFTCAEIPDSGHMGCAKSKKALKAFKPDGDSKKHRQAAEEAMPGVNLDEANIIAHFQDDDDGPIYVAATTPPGTGIVHVGLPTQSNEVKEVIEVLKPVKGKTLRFAQPGAGFMWANVDMEAIKKKDEVASAPPPLDSVIKAANGEFFIGGNLDPSGFQMHMGVTDTSVVDTLVELGAMTAKGIPKEIPNVPGSKVAFGRAEIDLGGDKRKGLHLSISGVKEANVLTQVMGLTLDGWFYSAKDVASVVVGMDEAGIKALAATEGDGLHEYTRMTLPKSLVESFDKGEVSVISHFPFDSLQGPDVRKLVDAALKNVEAVKPELVGSVLDFMAPFSSTTTWITQSDSHAVVHFAVRGIGNSKTEEGKEALAAMEKVIAGGSREEIYGALAKKYPATSHTNAYKVRAGIESRGLAGSGIGLIAGAAAVGGALYAGQSNDALAEDLGVEIKEEPPAPPEEDPVEKPDAKAEEGEDAKAEDAKVEEKKPAKKKAKKTEPKKEPEKKKPTGLNLSKTVGRK